MAGAAGTAGTSMETPDVAAGDDVYGSAFDEATAENPAEDTAAAVADLAALDKQEVTDPPVGDEGTAGTDGTAGTAGTAAPEPAKIPDDWAAREQSYLDQIAALKASAALPAPATPTPPPPPVDPLANLTKEERDALELYEQEYGDVAKFEGLKRKQELLALEERVKIIIGEAVSQLGQTVTPALEVAKNYSSEKHFSTIRAVHPDFEQLRDSGAVDQFIADKPETVKQAYQQVISSGTAAEVISLLNEVKKTITPQPAPTPKPTPTPTVVKTKTGPIIAQHRAGKDDYDGAAAEAGL